MAFTAITTTEIETGKPVAQTTQQKIKDNFDNLDSRITGLETGTNVDYPPLIMKVDGYYGSSTSIPITGILKTTMNFNIEITGARIYIDMAGSVGTTEIDLKYSRAGGAYTSIFTTLPSVSYLAGDDAVSSNAVLDPLNVNLEAGDLLRLDITSAQTDARSFFVRIDYGKVGL